MPEWNSCRRRHRHKKNGQAYTQSSKGKWRSFVGWNCITNELQFFEMIIISDNYFDFFLHRIYWILFAFSSPGIWYLLIFYCVGFRCSGTTRFRANHNNEIGRQLCQSVILIKFFISIWCANCGWPLGGLKQTCNSSALLINPNRDCYQTAAATNKNCCFWQKTEMIPYQIIDTLSIGVEANG